jgi:UDP-N-acetylmuramoyl-tripeptide--D-alanyl-D-alanine ligase
MTIQQLYDIYLRHLSIRTDTRQLQPGDLFFALKGPNFNGNQFAVHALEQGAAYAIIDEPPAATSNAGPAPVPAASTDPRLILVADVLTTLQDLALHHRRQFNIPFIAITGSNGKTTTKELIHVVLSSEYITYTTQGNLNNHIGIPLTILSVRPDAQFAVIEMGANHQKEIEGYCRYTLPTHGIITNVGKAHLEGFGGPEGVRKGKGELYDFLRASANRTDPSLTGPAASRTDPSTGATASPGATGAAFIMWDYDYLREMSQGIPHIIKYGTHDADLTGIVHPPVRWTARWTSSPPLESGQSLPDPAEPPPVLDPDAYLAVKITHGANIPMLPTNLVGAYNLPNVLAAVAVGKHFGVPDSSIKEAIRSYIPTNSRSQRVEWQDNYVILDAYNANPSSMRAAIENFAGASPGEPTQGHPSPNNGEKVLILGAMAELGPESLAEHQAIIDLIQKYDWENVVLVGGDFLKIPHGYLSFTNSREAGKWLHDARLKGAYILIKGSRSMKMEEVLNAQA